MTSDPLESLRLPVVPIEPRPQFASALLRRIQAGEEAAAPQTATVRYFVNDVDTAVRFYCRVLQFEEELPSSPAFAMLYRGDLRLLLSVPGANHALPDGTLPEPGGWNRIAVRVADLDGTVEGLRQQRVRLRTDVVTSVAVRQILLEDPSGNFVELFEPRSGYHERDPDNAR